MELLFVKAVCREEFTLTDSRSFLMQEVWAEIKRGRYLVGSICFSMQAQVENSGHLAQRQPKRQPYGSTNTCISRNMYILYPPSHKQPAEHTQANAK